MSGNDLFVSTVGTKSLGQLGMPNNLGTIGEYNATNGAPINANFITGLDIPTGLAVLGNNLFSADYLRGTISEYGAVTGAAIDSGFVTQGLSGPEQIATSGNTIFVANQFFAGVGVAEFDATTGAAVGPGSYSGLYRACGIAVTPVPEPSSCSLIAVGSLVLAGIMLRRRSRVVVP